MLYGRTPGVPTDAALQSPVERSLIGLDDYCSELTTRMSTAWESARERIKVSQGKQKQFYDCKSKDPKISVGDRVMVYSPLSVWERHTSFADPSVDHIRWIRYFLTEQK